MIPIIKKDTYLDRINDLYKSLKVSGIPLDVFEATMRKINILSFKLFVYHKQKVLKGEE